METSFGWRCRRRRCLARRRANGWEHVANRRPACGCPRRRTGLPVRFDSCGHRRATARRSNGHEIVRVCVWVCLACAVPSAAAAQGRQAGPVDPAREAERARELERVANVMSRSTAFTSDVAGWPRRHRCAVLGRRDNDGDADPWRRHAHRADHQRAASTAIVPGVCVASRRSSGSGL